MPLLARRRLRTVARQLAIGGCGILQHALHLLQPPVVESQGSAIGFQHNEIEYTDIGTHDIDAGVVDVEVQTLKCGAEIGKQERGVACADEDLRGTFLMVVGHVADDHQRL